MNREDKIEKHRALEKRLAQVYQKKKKDNANKEYWQNFFKSNLMGFKLILAILLLDMFWNLPEKINNPTWTSFIILIIVLGVTLYTYMKYNQYK